MTFRGAHTSNFLPFIVLRRHCQCIPMSMLAVFISVMRRCGDTNLNYMTAPTILYSLLSQTANRQSNSTSFNPDSQRVVVL